jgi:hypothetical protein
MEQSMKPTQWIACLSFLVMAAAQSDTARGQETAKAPDFAWKQSLPIRSEDPQIAEIGGTEIRALVPFDGRLYAANGYWMDSEKDNPALPGAQVLRLDGPSSGWRVDLELNARNERGLRLYQAISTLEKVQFGTDAAGQQLAQPVDLLLAAAWKRGLGLDIFSRKAGSGPNPWAKTAIPGQEEAPRGTQVRAFFLHHDRQTGVDIVFAGAKNAIFAGKYDSARQGIVWDGRPEWEGEVEGDQSRPKGRVSSFATCNGKLYAAAYDTIYERADGRSPSWKSVFKTSIQEQSANVTGFRGLTCIPDASGPGEVLLVGVEDNPARIYKIAADAAGSGGNYKASKELDVSSFLSSALGTQATYTIVAYNNMTQYPDPSGGACPRMLVGLETNTPGAQKTFDRHDPNAHFLIRDCHGGYALREVRDPQVAPKPSLVSVRALAVSPFASDPPGTIYAGGFDTNRNEVHNTAWLYKGVPTAAAH